MSIITGAFLIKISYIPHNTAHVIHPAETSAKRARYCTENGAKNGHKQPQIAPKRSAHPYFRELSPLSVKKVYIFLLSLVHLLYFFSFFRSISKICIYLFKEMKIFQTVSLNYYIVDFLIFFGNFCIYYGLFFYL